MTSTNKYFYFKDENYPIEVTDETINICLIKRFG